LAGQMGCVNPLASANPLFRDSTYSNYRNSTVFDSTYSIRCHRIPVPWEHSSDTVHLQYVLHKLTSQIFSKSHRLPHPTPTPPPLYSHALSNVHAQRHHYPPHHHSAITLAGTMKFLFFVLFCILTIIPGSLCAHPHLRTPMPVQPDSPH